ncbi:MAG TPA: alpha/beta hydrolase [Methanothrix sp.]|nr:alpha/beta hydrolase [Methanothrix sp.]
MLSVATHNCIGMDHKEEKDHSITEEKIVPVGDISIAYRVLGQGDPIVLIMGYSSTMDIWDPRFLDNLSSNYRVIIFDNRGIGNTTAPPGNFSIAQFANDTVGLMAALGIEKAHILGWSMGSFVAQELAIRYPERVDKVILYAADCGGKEAVMPSPQVLKDLSDTSGTPEEIGMRQFNLLFPKDWLSKQPPFYEWFPLPKETSLPENIQRQTQAIATWPGACDRLGSIKSPALVVTGAEDVIAPPENAFILAKRINFSWLVQFEEAGHGLMYQYPDRLAKIVVDFIELS